MENCASESRKTSVERDPAELPVEPGADACPRMEEEPIAEEEAEPVIEVGPEGGAVCPCACSDEEADVEGPWWRSYEEPNKSIEDFTAREVGIEGEYLAARYLARHGFSILEQNWRTKFGEVDIVARDPEGTIVLVEVKTRLVLGADKHAMPELAVDGKKQRTYRKLGLVYLMSHGDCDSLRFDVMAINIIGEHAARLRHLVGAFGWDA